MADGPSDVSVKTLVDRIAVIERKIRRIEDRMGLEPLKVASKQEETEVIGPLVSAPASTGPSSKHDEFEFEVGQSWFAKVGIIVLAIGIGVTLTRPFPNLPSILPAIIGFATVGFLALLAWFGRNSFEMLAAYLRRAAMALAAFSAFRLFFFGSPPVFATDSWVGRSILLGVAAINLAIAIRRKSPYMTALSLLMGLAIAILIPSDWFSVIVIAATCAFAVAISVRQDWPVLLLITTPLAYVSYVAWVFLNPVPGAERGTVGPPGLAVYLVLVYVLIFAAGSLYRRDRKSEDGPTILNNVLNCSGGYLTFLFHTLAASASAFVTANLMAAVVYLGLSVAFWIREKSQVATFLYSMTGYMAVTAALVRAFDPPEIFIWLSVQSLLVVVTAAWFRSRFIVVANFLIFLVIVASYIGTTEVESGMSLVFGLVALITARLLNWRTTYLEMKSEPMRNAYLFTAFILFPYALYHLVPDLYISLSWIGIALLYYLLSHLIRNRKYRWMGHGTLLLSALYLVFVGLNRLEPTQRSISLLVLGAVLLTVSVIFTVVRSRQREKSATPPEEKDLDGAD